MKTVELSVPHISLALKRGERLVLQDVLRVERAGDDLLAWVRQVDGSIQLQRLQAFFAPGMDVLLESQPVDGQSGKTEIFTASNDVPTTVFASKAVAQPEENSLSTLQDFEGDVLWLQLLVDDLAQLDQVWGLLAKQLHSAQSTLGNVYIKAVNDFEPIQLGDVTDVTMDRPSYFSQSVVPAHVPLKPVPSVTHLRLLVADDTGVAADGLTSKTTPTIWGKTDPWTVVRLVVDVDGDGSVSDAEAAAFLAEVAADVVGNFSWNDWPAPLAHGTSLNILALGWDRASRSWSNADPTTGLPVNVPPEARLHLTIDTQANLPTLNDLAVDNAISLSEQAAGVVFSGTGEPGAQVFLQRVQGSLSPLTNEVLVDAQGHWSVTVNQSDWGQMASGSMTVQVRQVDPAGNDSGWTSPISVSLDLILAAPSGLQISSDTGADATDGVTLTTQQVISGFAVPGTTVKVFKDLDNDGLVGAGELLSTVTADAATGAFQSDPLTFVDGSYRLRAIASAGGVDSLASSVKTLTVDTLAPQPSMSDAAGAAQGPGFINISKRDAGTSFGGAS